MHHKFILFLLSCVMLVSCGDNDKTLRTLTLKTNSENNIFKLGDTLKITIKNSKNVVYNGVTFFVNEHPISDQLVLDTMSLGIHKLKAGPTSGHICLNGFLPKAFQSKTN